MGMAQYTKKTRSAGNSEAVRRCVSQRRVRKPFSQTLWGGLTGMWVNQVLGVEARFVLYTSTVYGSPTNKTQPDKKGFKNCSEPLWE